VLAVTGPHQYEAVVAAIHAVRPPAHDPFMDLVPPEGIRLTPRHYAYLKISEGCHNRCTFCIIPNLRGDLVSRPAADVMREAELLVAAGVKELLVVSQDTSAYGLDLRHTPSTWRGRDIRAHVIDLAAALGELGVWVRLHYVYPYPHVDALLPLMAGGMVLPYLDIPFQHASPRVLKAMRRPANAEKTLARLAAWRAVCPDLTVRSTFIVGFPGETEADFAELLAWLDEAKVDRAGCFRYEPVAGAAANALPDPVPEQVKQERYDRLMLAQRRISKARLARKVGTVVDVIVDRVDGDRVDGDGVIGRTKGDAPEIDGVVHLDRAETSRPGDIVRARIDRADAYDLFARLVAEDGVSPRRLRSPPRRRARAPATP
jgi:ribosomal protein S12 methylthiotransferase